MANFDFPWEAYMQARAQKNKNQQQMMETFGQTLASLGQNIGEGLQKRGQMKAQQAFGQALTNAQQPVQGPSNVVGVPGSTTPNVVPPQQPPIDFGNLYGLAGKAYPGQAPEVMGSIMKNFGQPTGKPTSKTPASIYMNPEDPTDLSPTPKPGYIEYKTTSGDVLGKLVGGAQAKQRNKAMEARGEAWQRSIDVKQINELAHNVGLTPKQQSALQMNNLRADRAISILQNPSITWQELALGEIDLAGIMQGGVPHVDEVKNTHFPGWQEEWAKWKTYATGHPVENVPEPIRKKVLDLVQGVIKIDNKFIQENAQFRKKMIAPTIRGGIGQFAPAINQMTNVLTTQPGESDLSNMSDDELRKIAGGQ